MVKSSTLLISILTILAALSLSVSVSAVIHVNNTEFSIGVPDNWVYEEPSLFGLYVGVALTPNEFGEILFNKSKPLSEKMQDGGAYSTFSQTYDYPIKNALLDLYVKYEIDKQDGMKVTSIQNVTIDGEPTVKIYADGIGIKNFTGIKFVQYILMHNKEPYKLGYMANVKDFEKYLPEFEQIVKSFKFVK